MTDDKTSRSEVADRYLELLKRVLTRVTSPDTLRRLESRDLESQDRWLSTLVAATDRLLDRWGLTIAKEEAFDPRRRAEGRDWPIQAETMIGLARLTNLQESIETLVDERVPGDLFEAGVWRGGAGIFMRAALEAFGDADKVVWLADSFRGLPRPDPTRYPVDSGDEHHTKTELAVPLDEVERNFERYGLLDERVRFLAGWFEETLPGAPVEELSLLRVDGDMYGSTMVTLENLYPKLSEGAYVIIDDYGAVSSARRAVDDFRERHSITEPLHEIDWTGVYWRRALA